MLPMLAFTEVRMEDNPGNTFGRGIFDAYLNEKLGEKIHDLVGAFDPSR